MPSISPSTVSPSKNSYQDNEGYQNELGGLKSCNNLDRASGNSDISLAEFEHKSFILKKTNPEEKEEYKKLRDQPNANKVLIKSYSDDYVKSKISTVKSISLPARVEETLVMDQVKNVCFDYKLGSQTARFAAGLMHTGNAHRKDTYEMTKDYSFRDTAKGAPLTYTETVQNFENKIKSPAAKIAISDSLNMIKEFITDNDLSYRGASVIICHDEDQPQKSKALLIDLAHPHTNLTHQSFQKGMIEGITNLQKMIEGGDKGMELQSFPPGKIKF